jgi:hypothetical protein
METHWNAEPVGEIDPEVFTDFATVRPSVAIQDGHRSIRWPATQIWTASPPGADVVLVLGPEPALRWRLFSQQVLGLANAFEASMAISLGALLADYPHTRPVQVIGTASEPELIERFDLRRSTYEGPTGILGVLNDAFTTAGRPAASLWATVPGYAAQLPSPRACEALLRTACSMIGTVAPSGLFTAAIADYDDRVAALVAENDDLASYVGRLETLMDDSDDDGDDDDVDDEPGLDDDAGADLVEEVERYLKESGRESGPDAGGA